MLCLRSLFRKEIVVSLCHAPGARIFVPICLEPGSPALKSPPETPETPQASFTKALTGPHQTKVLCPVRLLVGSSKRTRFKGSLALSVAEYSHIQPLTACVSDPTAIHSPVTLTITQRHVPYTLLSSIWTSFKFFSFEHLLLYFTQGAGSSKLLFPRSFLALF
ncbi:hypothetical protein BDW62DRAFT_132178 [Aspergillus aurantiobrunneus]